MVMKDRTPDVQLRNLVQFIVGTHDTALHDWSQDKLGANSSVSQFSGFANTGPALTSPGLASIRPTRRTGRCRPPHA